MGLGSLTYVGPGENVFLFIPNLIGYLRVVSLLLPPATSPPRCRAPARALSVLPARPRAA